MNWGPPPENLLRRYEVLSEIGRGGMGCVYRARDRRSEHIVALKILRRDLDQHDLRYEALATRRARFLREAQIAARLRHQNLVAVLDLGEVDGDPYLAMELIAGTSLRQHMTPRVPWPASRVTEALGWLLGVAEGLRAIHDAGFVHRDVKPENILIDADGVPKLIDFGLARPPTPPELEDLRRTVAAVMPEIFRTQGHHICGTPGYMPPEQVMGTELDGRADQFAWGRVAIELFTGVLPPVGAPRASMEASLQHLPAPLPQVFARCVALAATDRFNELGSVTEVLRAALSRGAPQGSAQRAAAPGDRLPAPTPLDAQPRSAAGDTARARGRLAPLGLALGTLGFASAALVVAQRREGQHLARARREDVTNVRGASDPAPSASAPPSGAPTTLVASTSMALGSYDTDAKARWRSCSCMPDVCQPQNGRACSCLSDTGKALHQHKFTCTRDRLDAFACREDNLGSDVVEGYSYPAGRTGEVCSGYENINAASIPRSQGKLACSCGNHRWPTQQAKDGGRCMGVSGATGAPTRGVLSCN